LGERQIRQAAEPAERGPRTLKRRSESVRLCPSAAGLQEPPTRPVSDGIDNRDVDRLEQKEITLMSLSNADVAKVALLARLRLSPEEIDTYTGQLNSIVDYVAQLQKLDTTGVEPLAHGIELRNVFRDDVRGPALDREQALANAPKRDKVGFLVPAVLE
jgi:aspartyl-tRNA(Asn)/glutamyl-tRNA(Gln) amidotransferase subunit C